MNIPFDLDPPIQTFDQDAFALGAILGHDRSAMPFIFNNYINLASPKDFILAASKGLAFRRLFFLPRIAPDRFAPLKLGTQATFFPRSQNDFIEAIFIAMNKGFLVRLAADAYHIIGSPEYLIRHRMHNLVIYGSTGERFRILGHCGALYYRSSECDGATIAQAYSPCLTRTGRHSKVPFLAYRFFTAAPIDVNLVQIVSHLRCYLGGQPITPTKFGFDVVYGSEVFDNIIYYISKYRIEISAVGLDTRIFSLILEHARCMICRIQYLGEHYGLNGSGSDAMDFAIDAYNISYYVLNRAEEFNVIKDTLVCDDIVYKIDQYQRVMNQCVSRLSYYIESLLRDLTTRFPNHV